jgi:dolichol-phosphate mannosyltransferase
MQWTLTRKKILAQIFSSNKAGNLIYMRRIEKISQMMDHDQLKEALSPAVASIGLSIVVPTFNEAENVNELLRRLEQTLGASGWEVIFVDDDSPDQTAKLIRARARVDPRVRCLQRIGRRGLSSACIEGMLASAAPVIAVMDADLQHDETLLPIMRAQIEDNGLDLVIGTRYGQGGAMGSLHPWRKKMSQAATVLGRATLKMAVSDPMSGFFMFKRQVLDMTVRNLSGIGFKILIDILLTARKNTLRVGEVPYCFRNRLAGQSKLDGMVIWQYAMLLADKTIGRFVPVRFVSFSLVGGFGVLIHMAILTLVLTTLTLGFTASHSIATFTTMIFNFSANNILTYRDSRLKGWAWFKGLFTFMAACGVGALANIGIAFYLFEQREQWVLAALAGVLVGAVWNYAITQLYTWGKKS